MSAAAVNASAPNASVASDRFGNAIDPAVYYARGSILRTNADEVQRQRQAFSIIRERGRTLGVDSVFNLTGLIRGFRFRESDEVKLQSFIQFNALDDGQLGPLALAHMGGSAARHDAFLCNRVSAATLATMMALIRKDDLVLSVVAPPDASHPSVKNAVVVSGGQFIEVKGVDAFEQMLAGLSEKPRMVIVTTISPSKRHLPEADLVRVIDRAKSAGALVMLDDAHMATRVAVHEEQPALALGADIAVWSMDKNMTGPRSGIVAGSKDLIREIRSKAFVFGLEAQIGTITAAVNALADFDHAPVKRAAAFADTALKELQPLFKGRGYRAGPGIALSGEDLLELAMLQSGATTSEIVPIEAIAVASMVLLKETGGVTIPISAMPGSACVYRVMMYPDGERMGLRSIVEGTRSGLSAVSRLLSDRNAARELVLG